MVLDDPNQVPEASFFSSETARLADHTVRAMSRNATLAHKCHLGLKGISIVLDKLFSTI